MAGVRRGPASTGLPHGMVHRGSNRSLEGRAPHNPGRPTPLFALAIRTALTLRAVFRLALRQTEGLIGSILQLLGLDFTVPDHSTLSRRAERLEVPKPSPSARDPVHLLVDSTGLRLCGPGEWLIEKHGTRTRRSWRKLHIGVDAETGQILGSELTTSDVDDGSQVEPLLDQIPGPLASFIGDGAYDQTGIYDTIAKRYPEADVIVPPRSTAVPTRRRRALRPSAIGISKASRSMDARAGRRGPGTLVGPWWSPPSAGLNE